MEHGVHEITGSSADDDDSLAAAPRGARQPGGGPYRASSGALIDALVGELDALDEAASRRARIVARLRALCDVPAEEPSPQPSCGSSGAALDPPQPSRGSAAPGPDPSPRSSRGDVAPALAGFALCVAVASGALGFAFGLDVGVSRHPPPPATSFAEPAAIRDAPPPPTQRAPAADPRDAVHHTEPGAWKIDPAALDAVLAAIEREPLRFSPELRSTDGGLHVYGVRRGSIVARLGVQNGDVLVSCDGVPLRSEAGIRDAYERLRVTGRAHVVLRRHGTRVVHDYVATAATSAAL